MLPEKGPWLKKMEIGNAVLLHGDCLEILPTLPKVDAVITDPPYNAGIDYGECVNDKREPDEYAEWCCERISAAELIANGPVLVFASVSSMLTIAAKKRPRWVCAWTKPMSFSHRVGGSPFLPHWEPCMVFGKVWGSGGRVPDWSMSDVWAHNPAQRNGHPCPKPESLLNHIVGKIPSGVICDPFMGSGTTGVACMNLGRKFIGIEIEKKYFDIAYERIDQAQRQGRMFA